MQRIFLASFRFPTVTKLTMQAAARTHYAPKPTNVANSILQRGGLNTFVARRSHLIFSNPNCVTLAADTGSPSVVFTDE